MIWAAVYLAEFRFVRVNFPPVTAENSFLNSHYKLRNVPGFQPRTHVVVSGYIGENNLNRYDKGFTSIYFKAW